MASKLVPYDPAKVMVVREVTPDIITLSIPFARFGLIRFGGRGTLVQLDSGSLLIFSPAALTQQAKSAVESLGGNLKYIVAPDLQHHLWIGKWKEAYPHAEIIAPQGLKEKRDQNTDTRGVDISHIFTESNKKNLQISEEFSREFDVEYVDSHPSKEIILLHKRSRTMLQADLLFNLPATEQYSKTGESATQGIISRIFASGPLSTAPPATWQKRFIWYVFSSKDRKGFAQSVSNIDKWDFDRIIPCHGEVIETGGKDVFRRLFGWHLDSSKKQT